MKVVFVHGALVFDGAWWWHRMVGPLADLGLESRAVELPSYVAPPLPPAETLGDMHADADVVREALDGEDGPVVVLVGHSYGGMVTTDAAAGHGNVEHLVYLDSAMPDLDETMADFGGEPGPWMDPRSEEGTMGIKVAKAVACRRRWRVSLQRLFTGARKAAERTGVASRPDLPSPLRPVAPCPLSLALVCSPVRPPAGRGPPRGRDRGSLPCAYLLSTRPPSHLFHPRLCTSAASL